LILSKAILCTGGLEALRAQINAAQNQKCFGLKDLPLAARGRLLSQAPHATLRSSHTLPKIQRQLILTFLVNN
jgi:hypothetical protein